MTVQPLFKYGEHGIMVPELNPECKWVLAGTGFVSVKLDGIHVKIINGQLWVRAASKTVIDIEAYRGIDHDLSKAAQDKDTILVEAFDNTVWRPNGIYEAVGPGIKGNPHNLKTPILVRTMPLAPDIIINDERNHQIKRGPGVTVRQMYDSIHKTLSDPLTDAEGICFHVEEWNGMRYETIKVAKVTKKDFGLPWPPSGDAVPLPVSQVPATLP